MRKRLRFARVLLVAVQVASIAGAQCFSAPSERAVDFLSRCSSHPSICWSMQNTTGRSTPLRWVRPRSRTFAVCPASLLTGNAGGIVHPVIEPYVLPVSPYEAFASGVQNDVPLLLGSNADEARALVDVTHDTAVTFDSDLEHSVGPLPPALLAAYPHATDEEARQAQLGLERDLRFGGTCGRGRGCKPEPARVQPFITSFASSRRSRPARCTRVGARATLQNSGMSSTTWTSRLGTGPRPIGNWLTSVQLLGRLRASG